MARYRGINHLAMVTGDMDQTILFWRDLLGMRMIAGVGRPGYRHYFFEVSATDLVAFFEWPGVVPTAEKEAGVPAKGPVIFDHVCLSVEAEEELWELKDRIEAARLWVSEVIDHGFIHSIFTFDPNGIALEISAEVQSVDLRKHPVMVESSPSRITREGSKPNPDHWPTGEPPLAIERKTYPGELRKLLQRERNIWHE